MSDEFLFSINTILPLLLLVLLGFIIKKSGLLPDGFYPAAEKLVFKVALPCSLFMNVYDADAKNSFSAPLIIFCVTGICVIFLVLCLTVPVFIHKNETRGAYIQGVFRSNFAILGLPLAQRLFPSNGEAMASSVMPFAIPMFNVFAVVILCIFAPSEKKQRTGEVIKKSLIGIITNPLIIGIVLALPFMITGARLPSPAEATLDYISNMVTPLALICLGASIGSGAQKKKLGAAVTASLLRTAVVPAIAITAAILLGFRDCELGIILILFGSPTAVSSYIMAKNMGSDADLAGQILLISTILCSVTLFFSIFILTSFSFIDIY